jgi:hypothetical protein
MGTEKRTTVHKNSEIRRLIKILLRIARFAATLLERELQQEE